MAMAHLHSGKQSGQARAGSRDHTKNISKKGTITPPSHRIVQWASLFFYIETSSTEQMQQTHVQRNIFRSPVIHLTSHECRGGGACVTSGMTQKYQAPCRMEWMLEERARVSA
ncbi:hypothetical protein TcG_09021 [Trypanosoma cruzi]|nr:hypothetical protein TcG_09021 [Trypanosoma cruzi]